MHFHSALHTQEEVEIIDGTSEYVLKCKDIYISIARPFPVEMAQANSKKEREESGLNATALVYGEITFDSFGTFDNPSHQNL